MRVDLFHQDVSSAFKPIGLPSEEGAAVAEYALRYAETSASRLKKLLCHLINHNDSGCQPCEADRYRIEYLV